MKAAVVGSRGLSVADMDKYLPKGITEIISGGAKGVDTSAKEFALPHGITITESLPDYKKVRKGVPEKKYEDYSKGGYCNRLLGWTLQRHKICNR